MKARQLALALLVPAVVASAVAVVYAKHESRKLFMALQALQTERDRMDVQWGRLQLEQSTWATHGKVEHLARNRLHMTEPAAADIVVVRP